MARSRTIARLSNAVTKRRRRIRLSGQDIIKRTVRRPKRRFP